MSFNPLIEKIIEMKNPTVAGPWPWDNHLTSLGLQLPQS